MKQFPSPISINFRATFLLPRNKEMQMLVSNKYLLSFITQRCYMTRNSKLM